MINAATKIYGVLGNPIEHSLSPLLHNTLAGAMNIDMAYMAFNVRDNIDDALKGAFALGINGMNVTIPYKKDVLRLVSGIDEKAKKIGAVNTLMRSQNGYNGYNTDIKGLELAIKNNGLSVNEKNVIILGAGGAAKAALYLAVDERAKSITIINRDLKKAEGLKKEIDKIHTKVKAISLDSLKSDLEVLEFNDYFVFQTTNVGMHPFVNDCIIVDEKFYKKCSEGIDLIYTPQNTAFIKNMRAEGKKCINGLDMLIMQGVAAFELWNDVRVSEEIIAYVKDILLKRLSEDIK